MTSKGKSAKFVLVLLFRNEAQYRRIGRPPNFTTRDPAAVKKYPAPQVSNLRNTTATGRNNLTITTITDSAAVKKNPAPQVSDLRNTTVMGRNNQTITTITGPAAVKKHPTPQISDLRKPRRRLKILAGQKDEVKEKKT
ncbi:hypothetical protein SLEP1_g29583 [Rubroshorea leprosula]|uniref:Uncharacterized protein n=1 Tax=Rubroshorea leprosula TaxID=152421 RepID=A0AAV5JXC2_9ROSI|nr:hypothetical protein SLEP1_g29583 [Rubroshorea leprosula]